MTHGRQVGYGRRAHDADEPRERRQGPSRLVSWDPRKLALVSLGWVGAVLVLILVGLALSEWYNHGDREIRVALSRSNIIGLVIVTLLPPACLAFEWWMMHGRRKRAPRPEHNE